MKRLLCHVKWRERGSVAIAFAAVVMLAVAESYYVGN